MLISSLEQFLACAGCSSNVPYCSSPLYRSALMLLCQLLKSDKLSIFSIGGQKKATNSLATKLLISMVSSPSFAVFKWTHTPQRPSICLVCFAPSIFSNPLFTAPSLQNIRLGNQAVIIAGASSQIQHDTPPCLHTHATGSLYNEFVCDC